MAKLDYPVNGTVPASRRPNLISAFKALRDDAVTLVRQEAALAKREMLGKAASLGRNAAFLGLGGVVGLFGLFFVLLSLNNLLFAGLARAGFSSGVAYWLAPALTGVIILAIAMALVLLSLRGMRRSASMPERTLETLREDRQWLKGRLA